MEKLGGVQKLLLLAVFSPLFVLRWFLQHLPGGNKKYIRPSNVKEFVPPSLWLLRLLTLPLRILNPPEMEGLEYLLACIERGDKILLVGNQNLLGLDQMVLLALLYEKCGFFCRRMYDSLFGRIPIIRDLLELGGGIRGTKRNCEELMSEGQPLIFYPGGIEESFKTKNISPYSLLWGDRLGFIHMAIKHGYTLVPFSSIGMEDAIWVLFRVPLQPLLSLAGEMRPPTAFPWPLPYNTWEKQYVRFGQPITTSQYQGAFENMDYCHEAFNRLHLAVTLLIHHSIKARDKDLSRYVSGRAWLTMKALVLWALQIIGLGFATSTDTDAATATNTAAGGVSGGDSNSESASAVMVANAATSSLINAVTSTTNTPVVNGGGLFHREKKPMSVADEGEKMNGVNRQVEEEEEVLAKEKKKREKRMVNEGKAAVLKGRSGGASSIGSPNLEKAGEKRQHRITGEEEEDEEVKEGPTEPAGVVGGEDD